MSVSINEIRIVEGHKTVSVHTDRSLFAILPHVDVSQFIIDIAFERLGNFDWVITLLVEFLVAKGILTLRRRAGGRVDKHCVRESTGESW
jgi:hypothetical protein